MAWRSSLTTRPATNRMRWSIAARRSRRIPIIAPNPVIVVEVLSPSTGKIDKTVKRADYFRVPAVMHYVIVDLMDRRVLHDRRLPNGDIGPAVVTGELVFDPPGITIAVESFLD